MTEPSCKPDFHCSWSRCSLFMVLVYWRWQRWHPPGVPGISLDLIDSVLLLGSLNKLLGTATRKKMQTRVTSCCRASHAGDAMRAMYSSVSVGVVHVLGACAQMQSTVWCSFHTAACNHLIIYLLVAFLCLFLFLFLLLLLWLWLLLLLLWWWWWLLPLEFFLSLS